jgi:HEXXH motif-containing protein
LFGGVGAASALFGFGPDADRAATLDQRVRDHLADSLGEVADAIGPDIGFALAAAAPTIQAVRTHPVPPQFVGLYTDLVDAALREDAATAASCAAALPAFHGPATSRLQPLNFSDVSLGQGQAARYRRLINDDPELTLPMDPVDAAEQARAARLIAGAMALLGTAAPEIAAELRALISQIILVDSTAPAADKEALVFDGASSFYLWGALFINAARQRDRLSMAVALVHEASHSLLFGMTLGAPLVENDNLDRFPSPLRHDPRPMDGLVHATYVLARMADCVKRLLESGTLSTEETALAEILRRRYRHDHESGLAVVTESARFTPDGNTIFAAMRQADI